MGYSTTPRGSTSCLCLLLIVIVFVDSVPIYGGWPDAARRVPQRTNPPGCIYKGQKYDHGEQVATPEPCLNCTCNRGVLVCYLRVCPTASAPPPGCFPAREMGQCCPTVICGFNDLLPQNPEVDPADRFNREESSSESSEEVDVAPNLRPTFRPSAETSTEEDISSTEVTSQTSSTYTTTGGKEESVSTADRSTQSEITETEGQEPTSHEEVSSSSPDGFFAAANGSTSVGGASVTTVQVSITTLPVSTTHKSESETSKLETEPTSISPDTLATKSDPTSGDHYTNSYPTERETEEDTTPTWRDETHPTDDFSTRSEDGTKKGSSSEVSTGHHPTTTALPNSGEGETTSVFTPSKAVTDGGRPIVGSGADPSPGDSLLFVTSSTVVTPIFGGTEYDFSFLNDIPGGCFVNGTLYGDGSAMLSTSFCEYCFCIRGKQTCLKPKCHLAIEGCRAQYDSEYTCCPSRYDCSNRNISSTSATTESSTTTTELPTATTILTTTVSTESSCIVEGFAYKIGQSTPSQIPCHTCYCSATGVTCEKIGCSPAVPGCEPVIPEGHCCPVEYKCGSREPSANDLENEDGSKATAEERATKVKMSEEERQQQSNKRTPIDESALHWPKRDEDSVSGVTAEVSVSEPLSSEESSPTSTTVRTSSPFTPDHFTFAEKISTFFGLLKPAHRRVDDVTDSSEYLKMSSGNSSSSGIAGPSPVYIPRTTPDDHLLSVSIGRTFTLLPQHESGSSSSDLFTSPIVEKVEVSGNSTSAQVINNTLHSTRENDRTLDLWGEEKSTDRIAIRGDETKATLSTPISESHTFHHRMTGAATEQQKSENNDGLRTETISSDESAFTKGEILDQYLKSNTPETISLEDLHKLYFSTNTHYYAAEATENEATSTAMATSRESLASDQRAQKNQTVSSTFDDSDLHSGTTTEIGETGNDALNIDILKYGSASDEGEKVSSSTSTEFLSEKNVDTSDGRVSSDYLNVLVASISDMTSSLTTSTPPTDITIQFRGTNLVPIKDVASSSPPFPLLPHMTDSVTILKTDNGTSSSTSVTSTSNEISLEDKSEQSVSDLTESFSTTADEEETTSSSRMSQQYTSDYSLPHQSSSYTLQDQNIVFHSASGFESTTTASRETTASLLHPNHSSDEGMSQISTELSVDNDPSQTLPSKQENVSITPQFIGNEYTLDKGIGSPSEENVESGLYHVANAVSANVSSTMTTSRGEMKDDRFKDENQEDSYDYYSAEEPEDGGDGFFPGSSSDQIGSEETSTINADDEKDILKTQETTDHKLKYGSNLNSEATTSSYRVPQSSSTSYQKNDVADIYVGVPLSVGGDSEERKGSSVYNNFYILGNRGLTTQSDGVIIMDPKYTDISLDDAESSKVPSLPHFPKTTELSKFSSLYPLYFTTSGPPSIDRSDTDPLHLEKKKPRIEDPKGDSDPNFRIIPFLAEDAILNHSPNMQTKGKNKTVMIQQASTQPSPEIVSDFCFINGRIFINGEMIIKPDPCELCRCFYGRELCQLQRCPNPPSTDCVPEHLPGFCCPRYTCGNNAKSQPDIAENPNDQPSPPEEASSVPAQPFIPFISSPTTNSPTTPPPSRHGVAFDYNDDWDIVTSSPKEFHDSDEEERNKEQDRQTEAPPPPQLANELGPKKKLEVFLPPAPSQQPIPEIITAPPVEEPKFGIRVRPRPNPLLTSRPTPLLTKKLPKPTATTSTTRPPVTTSTANPPSTTATTTTTTTKTTKRTMMTTTSTEGTTTEEATTIPPQTTEVPFFDPWGLLKVSGCNIYGKFYSVNERIDILGGPCNQCICGSNGVECNGIC